MSEWRETRLGDICELKRGYDLPKASRRPGLIPIISSSGRSGHHDEAKVRGPGVVTGRYGTLGQVFYVEEDFWPLNTALYVRDFKNNEPRFVAALLESMKLGTNDGAAAVPGVNRNQLHELPVLCPDPKTQSSIAAVLAALDDLILNNRRRIGLWERTAQAIYREWFVRFRYPCHEGAALVTSPIGPIPEGWKHATWGDLATLEYGKALRDYKQADGGYPVFGTNGQIGWHDTPIFPPGVVVGRKGAYRGIHYSSRACWAIDTAFYLRIFKPETVDPLFAFHQLRDVDLDAIDSGSAIPSTSRAAFYAIPLVVPPPRLMTQFADIARSTISRQQTSENSCRALATIRDLLLPKLVTGQIDVSELDLDAVVGSVA